MPRVDLTPFGFTPTESLVYEVLLTAGPGTGYAIARAAGLARANAYSALEGLVTKGAARADGGRPRHYRPEDTTALIARIANDHGQALDRLSADVAGLATPSAPTLVDIDSPRAALQLISHDVARAEKALALLAPPEAYPLLAPALRRPAGAGVELTLLATGPVELPFATVASVDARPEWPGTPLICVVDHKSAVVAYREGNDVHGHWSTAPALIAAARVAIGYYGRSA
ncbi:MAG TPA: helix-turn-helix domain-containing protein [Gemmatimonadales bacterium]|jgi:sugar-specific transcriptional regulator TrmB|nr:helix-turn-helix domain-containing protein [Gemmatimonadales bacterium]